MSELDEQEAALYLSMMQVEEAVRAINERLLTSLQSIADESQRLADRRAELQEKELIKQEDKLKCASCGTTDGRYLGTGGVEPSVWNGTNVIGKPMVSLCYLCSVEAEHDFYDGEATEVSDEGSI